MNEAEKTNYLIERINQNENFQSVDINKWAFVRIQPSTEPLKILELCCGTGKQTQYLLSAYPNAEIFCLDISADAINSVKEKFGDQQNRMKFFNFGIDEFFSQNNEIFDIIFCSYGLYYATDINTVFKAIDDSTKPGSRLMVMGPYGNNNSQLFGILTSVGVQIADFVMHSSSTFMYRDLINFTLSAFQDTHCFTTKNSVKWDSVESVMSYWRNSTFYDKTKEAEAQKAISDILSSNENVFQNDKHIMLLIAIK